MPSGSVMWWSFWVLIACLASSTQASFVDEGVVRWTLGDWGRAARGGAGLIISLPSHANSVEVSGCFISIARDHRDTTMLHAQVSPTCTEEKNELVVTTHLRGPEFYGGYVRDAKIFPALGNSRLFVLSMASVRGLGDYDANRYWKAHDTNLSVYYSKIRSTRITARWVGLPAVRQQQTLPLAASFVCVVGDSGQSVWEISNLDEGSAHSLIVGDRLFTVQSASTTRALVTIAPPFSIDAPLAHWVGALRWSDGVPITAPPTVRLTTMPLGRTEYCYCGVNVVCATSNPDARFRRVKHPLALAPSTLLNGPVSVTAAQTFSLIEGFSETDTTIFKITLLAFSCVIAIWCLWSCLAQGPSTLVPMTLEGLKFRDKVQHPYDLDTDESPDVVYVSRKRVPQAADEEEDGDEEDPIDDDDDPMQGF